MIYRRSLSALLLSVSLLSGAAIAATQGVLIKSETVYAQPSSSAKRIASLSKGSSVNVITKQGGWLQVGVGASKGWVRMLSVRTSGAVASNSGADFAGIAQMATGKRQPGKIVATAGVRGLSEEDLKSAHFSEQGMSELAGYKVSTSAAKNFAKQGRLVKQNIAYLPAPVDNP
ncbi:MAG: SH3 domain-containing protein [Sulfuriferula sp.]